MMFKNAFLWTNCDLSEFTMFSRQYFQEPVNRAPVRLLAQPAEAPVQKFVNLANRDIGKIGTITRLQCFLDHIQVPRGRIVTRGTYGKRQRLVNEVFCKLIEFWITVQFTHFISPCALRHCGDRIRFD